MTSLLYLGCPAPERADTEKPLGSVDVAVVWAENAALALDELLSQMRSLTVARDPKP